MFEAIETTSQTLARSLIELLDKYGLRKKIIAYVKDEGSNLNAMTTTLKAVVNCEPLGLKESFKNTCFGHAFSKASQYYTPKEKVCKDLKYVSIKSAQAHLQKCIIWPKKFGKGKQELNKVCLETSIRLRQMYIQMKTK